MNKIRAGFRSGEKGFTLIEIMIVLAVMAVLAAVIIPSVAGYLGQSKARAWEADRNVLQATVDTYRTDVKNRTGNPWPTMNTTGTPIGVPTFNASNNTSFTNVAGIINIAALAGTSISTSYLRGADAVKSAISTNGTRFNGDISNLAEMGAINSPSGNYVWYIDNMGIVHSVSLNVTGTNVITDFQTDVYP